MVRFWLREYGHFRGDVVRMYSPSLRHTIDVVKTKEKGSDVNLATYVLADAFRQGASSRRRWLMPRAR